jgi:hypothetical protein
MDRQRTQPLGPNTKTAQAPAEPIRPPEVNRVPPGRGSPDAEGDDDRKGRDPTSPHPGSPQTPK